MRVTVENVPQERKTSIHVNHCPQFRIALLQWKSKAMFQITSLYLSSGTIGPVLEGIYFHTVVKGLIFYLNINTEQGIHISRMTCIYSVLIDFQSVPWVVRFSGIHCTYYKRIKKNILHKKIVYTYTQSTQRMGRGQCSPCFQKKGDRYTASNYRLISLTHVCAKLLEHIICKNIMTHITKN